MKLLKGKMMSLIHELSDWQRNVLLAAGCIDYKTIFSDSVFNNVPAPEYFFTEDWNAKKAAIAKIAVPRLVVTDCHGDEANVFDISEYREPYNIALPETGNPVTLKPEHWTVDSLMAAIREGRVFRFVKPGFESHALPAGPGCDLTIDDEMVLTHALNPANGWQIEEIV